MELKLNWGISCIRKIKKWAKLGQNIPVARPKQSKGNLMKIQTKINLVMFDECPSTQRIEEEQIVPQANFWNINA